MGMGILWVCHGYVPLIIIYNSIIKVLHVQHGHFYFFSHQIDKEPFKMSRPMN